MEDIDHVLVYICSHFLSADLLNIGFNDTACRSQLNDTAGIPSMIIQLHSDQLNKICRLVIPLVVVNLLNPLSIMSTYILYDMITLMLVKTRMLLVLAFLKVFFFSSCLFWCKTIMYKLKPLLFKTKVNNNSSFNFHRLRQ